MKADKGIAEFLVSHGGPFYDLQRQLGLIRDNALRTIPRVLIFTGLTWGVPLLLSAAQGNAYGPTAKGSLPVSAAALLPLAAAGIARLPVKELLSIVKRLLLF